MTDLEKRQFTHPPDASATPADVTLLNVESLNLLLFTRTQNRMITGGLICLIQEHSATAQYLDLTSAYLTHNRYGFLETAQ